MWIYSTQLQLFLIIVTLHLLTDFFLKNMTLLLIIPSLFLRIVCYYLFLLLNNSQLQLSHNCGFMFMADFISCSYDK